METLSQTQNKYRFLWSRNKEVAPLGKWHFDAMQRVIAEPIVRGSKGIDVGSGCGYDTFIMARDNPLVKVVSIDLTDGVYKTKALTLGLENVELIKCSILDAPLKSNIFDFAYSYGVMHHTSSPQKGLSEIARILKRNSPAFLYLYEDHSENYVKYIAVKLISKLRGISIRIPSKVLYGLSWICSPFVFILFTVPAKILKKFKATESFAKKIPFNFAAGGVFSLRGDLYDRFGAPIEYRFNRQEIYDLFTGCGFYNVNIKRLDDRSGWAAWGYKR